MAIRYKGNNSENVIEKDISDNGKFWKVVKPLLPKKIVSNEKVILIEYKEIIKTGKENAKVFHDFFSILSKILIFCHTIKKIQLVRK